MHDPHRPAERPQPPAGTPTGWSSPPRHGLLAGLRRRALGACSATVLALLIAGAAAQPAGATVAMCNVPITMSDGIVLRANLYLPSSHGPFPTVLTVTGYNKDAGNPTGQD